jgi:dihydroorotase
VSIPGVPFASALRLAACALALALCATARAEETEAPPVEIPLGAPLDEEPQSYDLVIANGRVLDPESGVDGVRHLGIRGGEIVEVSERPLEARETLDATGLAVAPGFIDLHVHGQNPLSYDFMARDGVTTALDLELGAHGVKGFLRTREGESRIHYGVSAGHLPARIKVFHGLSPGHPMTRSEGLGGALMRGIQGVFDPTAYAKEAADEKQIRTLARILGEQIDQGGIGIGMRLADTPGAGAEEQRAVFELAAQRGVPVFVHLAEQQTPDDLAPLEVLLALARVTGASVHVVHVVSSLRAATPQALAAIDAAREQGLLVTTEVVPYTAGETPSEADAPAEAWIEAALRHRDVLVASDGMPMTEAGGEHPRSAGTHARVLGRYVRERQVLSLMDAIARMSWLPARRLEWSTPDMARKGRIRAGADADLVVFDPASVIDRATYEDSHQPSEGIAHVLVSGVPVVRDGALVDGALPGRPLRARVGVLRSQE